MVPEYNINRQSNTDALPAGPEQYGVEYYHKLQLEILDAVIPMLKPGGLLLYSTCTFSPEEDSKQLQIL